jgi:hypothetical protein
VVAVAISLMLLIPAFWNGFPLLQSDTGGYLARWYERYLVPSRSTVFGLYLHIGESSCFWLDLAIQALATTWILYLTLRSLGLARPSRLFALCLALCLTTALPFLASMLLTDIFAGLSILALFVLVLHGDKVSAVEKIALFIFIAFSAATHSATMAVLLGLCCVGWIARPFLHGRITVAHLLRGTLAIPVGAAMLLSANYALSGQFGWTPGGYSLLFARMLEDGIVTRYLNDHCPTRQLKLCPYRNNLPETADDFLWSSESVFNQLGRFGGMSDEMGDIAAHALTEYPLWQAKTALVAMGEQLLEVATGENTDPPSSTHTYGIFRIYLRDQLKVMEAARQQTHMLTFGPFNLIHVPVALISTLLVFVMLIAAAFRRRIDDVTILTATVCLALLGNAAICGIVSGPHDRYGSRLVWITTLVVMIAVMKRFCDTFNRASQRLRPAHQKIQNAGLVDLVPDRAHVIAVWNVEHLRARNDRAEFVRRARDIIDRPDRDQHRHLDLRRVLFGHQATRTAQTCGKRLSIGPRLIGKRTKRPPDRIGDVVQGIRFQRRGDILARTTAIDQAHADATKNGGSETLRLAARQCRGHPRTQRIAHDIGPTELQMIHQSRDIARHDAEFILRGVIQLCGIAVTAIVEGDDATAAFLQVRNPGRIDPVHVLAGGKPVHQHNRIALAFVEIGNFNSAVMKTRHR